MAYDEETEDFSVTGAAPDDGSMFQIPDLRTSQRNRLLRRQQAQKYLDQSTAGGGQMIGNIFVPKSPWVSAAEGFAGSYQGSQLDEEERNEQRQLQEIQSSLLRRLPSDTDRVKPLGMPASLTDEERTQVAALTPTGSDREVRKDPRQYANELSRWGVQASLVPGMQAAGATTLKQGLEQAFARKEAEPFTLGEGQQRFDARGNPVASVAVKAEKPPTSVQEYNYAKTQGYNKSYDSWLKDKAVATHVNVSAPQRDRFQIVTDEDGAQHRLNMDTLEKTPIGNSKGGKPLNESQGNALLFGTRAQAAHKVLDEVGTQYSPMKTAIAKSAENVPGVNAAANSMLSGNEQKVVQAQRDFVNAILRKESGAAISPSEFQNAQKQYFPQVGDRPDVVAQKKANRELAISGLKAIAGRGASGSFDAPSQPTRNKKYNPATGRLE